MKKLQIAVVLWLDAYHIEENEPGVSGIMQLSAGVLIERKRTHVKLALLYPLGDAEPNEVLTIPRGMIRSIKIVHRVPAPRRAVSD